MRLNNENRQTILRRVTDRRLAKLDKQLEELAAKVGDSLADQFCAPLPEALRGMDLTDWVGRRDRFVIRIRTSDTTNEHTVTYPNRNLRSSKRWGNFERSSLDKEFKLSEPRFTDLRDKYFSPTHQAVLENKVYKKWFDTLEKATALREQIRAEVWPILLGANTAAQLLKVWPEVKPFMPPAPVPTRRDLVPVEKVAEINKLVALP